MKPAALIAVAALVSVPSCAPTPPRALSITAEDVTFEAGASCDEGFVVFHNLTGRPVFLASGEHMLSNGSDCGLALATYRNGEWDNRVIDFLDGKPTIDYSVLPPGATRRVRIPLRSYGIADPGEYVVRVAYVDCAGVSPPDGADLFGPRFVQMRVVVPPCSRL